MTTFVFVYGTLRKGHGNHPLLVQVGAKYHGKGIIRGYAVLTHGGLPFVVQAPDHHHVVGEVYEVPGDTEDDGFRILDMLESAYGRTTERVQITEAVEGCAGEYVAWVYGAFPGSLLGTLWHEWNTLGQLDICPDGDYDKWLMDRRLDVIEHEAEDDAKNHG